MPNEFELIRTRVESLRRSNAITPIEAINIIITSNEERTKVIDFANWQGIEITEPELDTALTIYNSELLRVQQLKDGDFASPEMTNGYILVPDADCCFGTYYRGLRGRGISDEDLNRILRECNVIVQQFLPQPSQNVDRRGLVIGQVQSGKTTIFNGLVSAAADIGFNVIIILSGTMESLRRQTQARVTSDVTELWANNPNTPFYFTWISNGAGPGMIVADNANVVLPDFNNLARRQIAIGVFLKNAIVLRRLRQWLTTLNPVVHNNIRALIIDDEADQATPNGGVRTENITPINEEIKNLVLEGNNFICPTQGRTSYLGFTATPFANLLNEAGFNTLYPKDFLYFLESSSRYFGPWQLFGNPDEIEGTETIIPLNVIRLLTENDIDVTVPSGRIYNPTVSEGLRKAIMWYLIASAARRSIDPEAWATMLIHTSSRRDHHMSLKVEVENFINSLKNEAEGGWQRFEDELRLLWEEEINLVSEEDFRYAFPAYGNDGPAPYPQWDNIIRELEYVVVNVKVKIDNSLHQGEDRMQFGDIDFNNRLQIGIGGNTLSRGITLEGLVSSYFARRFTNQSSYDTLLQMGRWFGYRKGYELLPRIWTTEFLRNSFRDLVIMEQNLRDQMNFYLVGDSPANRAPVITQMPAMAITRRSVIGNIEVGSVNFSGTAPQTIIFNNNFAWLQNNIEATLTLLENSENNLRLNNNTVNRVYYDNVPLQYVTQFLNHVNILSDVKFNKNLVINFINENINSYGFWSLVVIGGTSPSRFKINDNLYVFKNNRSRVKDVANQQDFKINLKSLRSTNELLADRPDLLPQNNPNKTNIWDIRSNNNLNPVLLIYPIDKESVYNGTNENYRASLRGYAVNDIIGMSIVMSPGTGNNPIKGVNIANIEQLYPPDMDEQQDELDPPF